MKAAAELHDVPEGHHDGRHAELGAKKLGDAGLAGLHQHAALVQLQHVERRRPHAGEPQALGPDGGPRRGVVGGRGANNRAPLMAAAVVAGRDSSAGAKGPGGAAFGEMGGLEREMAQMFTGCPL